MQRRFSETPTSDGIIYEWMRLKREDEKPARLIVSRDVWMNLVRESYQITGFYRKSVEEAEFMGMDVERTEMEGWRIETSDRAGGG